MHSKGGKLLHLHPNTFLCALEIVIKLLLYYCTFLRGFGGREEEVDQEDQKRCRPNLHLLVSSQSCCCAGGHVRCDTSNQKGKDEADGSSHGALGSFNSKYCSCEHEINPTGKKA